MVLRASASPEPHRYFIGLRALADAQITADRRLFWIEVLPAGARRPIRCESPVRPTRPDAARVRSLRAGESWGEWVDLRTLCWGRALDALDAGATLTPHYGTARSRTMRVAETPSGVTREIIGASVAFPAVTRPAAPEGPVRVSLAPADGVTGAHLALRVTIRGATPVRAWIRPDRVSFRVVTPEGERVTCSIAHAGGAAIPDLFARLSPTRGSLLSLDASQYCPARTFDADGVYEVTPILELDEDGRAFHMDTPLGRFEGAPAPVRVRAGTHGYVEHPIGGAS
jgi:hypothetical protein